MERECPGCGNPYMQWSTLQTLCSDCYYRRTPKTSSKPRKQLPRAKKPIKQRGKVANQDLLFRNKVVRPYLDKKYGRSCVDCGKMPHRKEDGTYGYHDVDHVLGKGAHAGERFNVENFCYRCRSCHEKKTGLPQWSGKTTITIACDTDGCAFSCSTVPEFEAHLLAAHFDAA